MCFVYSERQGFLSNAGASLPPFFLRAVPSLGEKPSVHEVRTHHPHSTHTLTYTHAPTCSLRYTCLAGGDSAPHILRPPPCPQPPPSVNDSAQSKSVSATCVSDVAHERVSHSGDVTTPLSSTHNDSVEEFSPPVPPIPSVDRARCLLEGIMREGTSATALLEALLQSTSIQAEEVSAVLMRCDRFLRIYAKVY